MAGELTTNKWTFLEAGKDGVSVSKDDNPNYRCVIHSMKQSQFTNHEINIQASLPQEFSISIGANYDEAMAQWLASTGVMSDLAGKARLFGLQLTTQALTAQVWQGSTELTFSIPMVFQIEKDEYQDVLLPISQLYELMLPDDTGNGFLQAPGPRLDKELMQKAVGQLVSGTINVAKEIGSAAASGVSSAIAEATSFLSGKVATSTPDGGKTASAPGANSPSKAEGGTPPPIMSSVKNNISLQLGQYLFFRSVVITNVDQTHKVQPIASGTMSRVEVNVTFKTFFVPTQKDIKDIFPGMKSYALNPLSAEHINARGGY